MLAVVGFALALMAGTALAQGVARPVVHVCVDERAWLPFTSPDPAAPGTMQLIVSAAARELGLKLVVTALPWRRCQENVRIGRMDGMIGAAYVPFNRELAVFPMAGVEVDSRRSLGTARVLLVKRRGSAASWNGRTFAHLTRPVGTPAGTSLLSDAVRSGAAIVDDGAKTDHRNLTKLLGGRVDLMAGYEHDIRLLIANNGAGKVVVLPVPLAVTHHYLALSKLFVTFYPVLAEQLWTLIGRSSGRAALVRSSLARPVIGNK